MDSTRGVSGLQLLEQIRPSAPKRRFLQSWDRETRVLRFGYGDDENGVHIGSDGSIEPAKSSRATKLRVETIKHFLDGVKPESPLKDIQGVLRGYVHFSDDRIYALFAAWIMGTYVYSLFSHFGYLFLHSQTPRCGKTRAEEVTSHLAFEATEPRNAPTPPSMRETAVDGGTAIFDTLERWQEKGTESFAAAMELLDAGFRNGGLVTKMVPSGAGDWKQEKFPVYAPYMFAAIERESLTDTALDRSFVVAMVRKSTKLKTRPYDARCEGECLPIRENLYLTALTFAGSIADAYESEQVERQLDTLGLNDRAADIWKPLFAITTALDEREISQALSDLAREMSPDPDRLEEKRQLAVVRALRTAAGSGGALTGTSTQIIDMLRQVTTVECSDLHGILSSWGFTEKSIRLPDFGTPRRAWEIAEADLAAIEASFDSPPLETATTTTTERPDVAGDGHGR
jgi:hypothetical protein